MVSEAEKYASEDSLLKEKVDAKNNLENSIYTMKNSIKDEKVKIEADDKAKAEKAINDA